MQRCCGERTVVHKEKDDTCIDQVIAAFGWRRLSRRARDMGRTDWVEDRPALEPESFSGRLSEYTICETSDAHNVVNGSGRLFR